jgi:putative SOS response-associated peptidase YedK
MCGRYTLVAPGESIAAEFGLGAWPAERGPRYNIAPTQEVAAVVHEADEDRLVFLRWGLVPSWSKDETIGARLINARGETVHEKPAFRSAFRDRRCLVLADGFYEWQRTPQGKVPMRIRRRDDRPFAFAGLWERRRREDREELLTCTIITTAASAEVRPVHDRMPVIVEPAARAVWLDGATPADVLRDMLAARPTPELEAYAVSTLVNSPRNDEPACIAPV